MTFNIPSLFFLFFIVNLFSCSTLNNKQNNNEPLRIAFYNVENLFDTVDDPLTHDEDFTPAGRQKWTPERYRTKLQHLGQVIGGMHYPALLGLCEVENKTVLEDLCNDTGLAGHGYKFVHFDSPDFRGIDVALLYQKKRFKVLGTETVRIPFPDEIVPEMPGYTSRDLLVVEGILNKKTKVHLIVAHFPSRRGGLEKSEPKRLHVAGFLRKKIDEIMTQEPDSRIIVMGDFNDEPANKSITEILRAQPVGNVNANANAKSNANANAKSNANGELFNCFSEYDKEGKGSYNYRGNWNMLDQIMLSGQFFQANSRLHFQSATIFREDYMMYKNKKYGATPSRTYGGPNYYGGYSDHLPVFIELGKL
ncbi:MAG TPA: hypothetical protein ENJ95_09445 [Bacteroidetes bacterium]|nr:hypothetical protein [Bacteroidota bacterium]